MLKTIDHEEAPDKTRAPKGTFMNSVEFEKKLRWLVTNPPRNTERWRITPAMAKVMLAWNDRNRPVTSSVVKDYADTMNAGRWAYTGEPIIFSTSRLLDGQHRLLSCVASGAAFEALVAFGSPDESFSFIDVGKTRTAADVFAIEGVKNHVLMSAAIQWVVGYESGHRGVYAAHAGSNTRLHHAALYAEYIKHPALQESAWVASAVRKARIIVPSMATAIHYLCARKNRVEADVFFRKIADNLGFEGKNDPAYKLRTVLDDCAKSSQRLHRVAEAAITIKAWNASRGRRLTGKLTFEAGETFPRII